MVEPDAGRQVNQCIFEIRYRPNAKVLDYRGTWAELISKHMSLTEWRIMENRVDVHDKERRNHCFVGFRNSGFTTRDAPTENYFPDQTTKFFRFVLSLDGFEKTPFTERLGVRFRFLTPYAGTFEDLCRQYSERYLQLTEGANRAIGAKLVDIGGPLNFTDYHGNFNTMSGPVAVNQARELFDWVEDPPKVSLYYDIDYFRRPTKELSGDEILHLIKTFAKEGWGRHDRVRQLIMGT